MTNLKKIVTPASMLFERIAGELAGTFYNIGRSQGMTSKYKTDRAYARANIEKFLPKAIDYCIDMLARPDISNEMKELIYDALSERVNEPANITSTQLPELDMKKLIDNLPPIPQLLKPVREKPINIKTALSTTTAIGKTNG